MNHLADRPSLECPECEDGTRWTSRYGGNDPDVWPVGKCEACDGTGTKLCATRNCYEPAVGFNEDNEPICKLCQSEQENVMERAYTTSELLEEAARMNVRTGIKDGVTFMISHGEAVVMVYETRIPHKAHHFRAPTFEEAIALAWAGIDKIIFSTDAYAILGIAAE